MKINDFWGDLSDMSAKKASLINVRDTTFKQAVALLTRSLEQTSKPNYLPLALVITMHSLQEA